ncbi:MAG: FtsX-like permease family protein [Tannerella sp.]|nr:FtsX-like permease family protein [Tannerella sp.]
MERTFELGMLGAIGMGKHKIFKMIMYETFFLTIAGGAVGIVLATLVIFPSIHNGVDMTSLMGDSLEDYGFSSVVYPVLNLKLFTEIVVLVVVAGILSAIYPARKALKLKSLDAMREV